MDSLDARSAECHKALTGCALNPDPQRLGRTCTIVIAGMCLNAGVAFRCD